MPASNNNHDDDPNVDPKYVRMRTNKVTEESLDSTRRMVQLCDEAKDAGIRSLVALDDQGEQLEQIESGMDQINSDMREAEKNLTGMRRCCGLCILPWSGQSEFREDTETWDRNRDDGKVVSNQPTRLADRNGVIHMTGHVSRYTNDAREDEMEENITQVTTMVGNLRNMAIDMGSEINSQNRQLDRINQKGESNEVRISAANKVAVQILKD